tara:strand:- start:447 stop:1019 length:573 start_codon:yes stop_codon:yes gene_type:complete
MTRDFTDASIDTAIVNGLLRSAQFGPRAGNTQAIEFLVLEKKQVEQYWETTFSEKNRADFAWPNLFNTQVLVLVWVDPGKYVIRYAEADKRKTGLGDRISSWATPYWWVDGGMAAMTILLGAEAAGLGALFFGLFEHEENVKNRFDIPEAFKSVGAIALGVAACEQKKSMSTKRDKQKLSDAVHRGRWTT